ncbi:MAG: tetratricopeptide repeat protein, partial [Gemmatimonadetes bacterium]|nr:tetratricopeptide repeat protein [Gemmatimonadota bacterium]
MNTLRQIAAASLWPPLALVLIGIGVYANALSAPFIFDDHPAIVENEDIREVLPLWRAPETSARSSINSRPLVRLSLALNYTYGALRVEGYHAVNLATHIACALALYGLMLRALGGRARERAPAFCAALLWLVHPLNSQIVNYVTQRSESLMALCYLGVLYCVHRRADGGSAGWSLAATVCCLLGVASKEVMVTAPVVAVLYDRAFICGSIADALRSRKGLYTGLAASWLLLAGLMASAPHGDSVGFSQSVGAYQYLLNQCVVITGYLGKFIWPAPLLIDYGAPRNLTLGNVLAPALLLLVLLAAALYLAWRRPQAGFCALFFFVVLAPTSSIVPLINEVGADRRMYLPLCALCALLLGGAWRLSPRLAGGGCLVAAVMLSALTIERNTTYQVPLALWQAEVAAADDNYRTQNNLGLALIDVGEFQTAIFHFRRAMELEPVFAVEANNHIAMAFNGLGAYPEAIAYYRRSLAERPGYAPAHNNLGTTLLAIGDSTAARRSFRKALALDPQFALADNNLGALLVGAG